MGHLPAVTYTSSGSGGGGLLVLLLFDLVLYVVFALGMYGTFQKAGQPGWAAFVPIYNFIIMLKVAGRPVAWAWFLLLAIIPFIGSIALLVIGIIVLNDVSKSFGHGAGFTVGLVLLGPIFWYVLWLGKSQYRGPAALAGAGGYPGQYPPAGGYGAGGYPGQYPPASGYPPQQPGYPQQSPYPPAGQAPPAPLPNFPGQAPPPPRSPGQIPSAPPRSPGQNPSTPPASPGQNPSTPPASPGQMPPAPPPPGDLPPLQ